MLLNVLSLAGAGALGDGLCEKGHELAIAGKRWSGAGSKSGRAGDDELVAGEARVGAELLLGDNLVGRLDLVADDLSSCKGRR